jgi:hypothetical protein
MTLRPFHIQIPDDRLMLLDQRLRTAVWADEPGGAEAWEYGGQALPRVRSGVPAVGCSPEFPGRVIAALATDPELMDLSGGTFITAELAQRYGITDIDGKTIPSLHAERGSPIWQPITRTGHGR